MKFFFYISAWLLAYIYLLYPLLIWLLAKTAGRPLSENESTLSYDVVLVSRDDASAIQKKVENILAEASGNLSQIFVGLDGVAVEEGFLSAHDKVMVVASSINKGKAALINEILPQLKAELVVFVDTRQALGEAALQKLLAPFSDNTVMVVSGELCFRDGEGSGTAVGMGAYWHYEKWIRKNEGALGTVPGATGALYAVRRSGLTTIPDGLILDDVAIPLCAIAKSGRCVFNEDAMVWDQPSATSAQELQRKRRTQAGVLQLIQYEPNLLLPWRNRACFAFVSHKALRLLSPFALLGLWLGALSFPMLFVLITLIFPLAYWGAKPANEKTPLRKLASAAYLFGLVNWAIVLAWSDAVQGKYPMRWEKTS